MADVDLMSVSQNLMIDLSYLTYIGTRSTLGTN